MVDYTIEYYHEYYDIGGTLHRIELLLLEYFGGTTLIKASEAEPVRMRHTGTKTNFENTIIQGQELIFSFRVPRADADTFDALFESDYKDYKVRYYVGEDSDGHILVFEGYVKPENLSKQYSKNAPYMRITLSATDALADLKNVDFGNGAVINDTLTILEILKEALTPIDIDFDFQIQLGTYESDYMASDDCALEESQVDTRRFFKWTTGKREFMSCWQVIEAVLKDFNVKFKQLDGCYQITCHHELDSHEFLYDWATLTEQSRLLRDNTLDISAYKFHPIIDEQKPRPLNTAGIIFKNKDLGGNVTGMDLDDWGNDPPWEIDFSNGSSVAAGVVTLNSDDNTYDDFIETATFNVAVPGSGEKFLKITFDHILFAHTSAQPLIAPRIKITITRPDSSTRDIYFNCNEYWESYESPIYKTFKIVATGNYSVRLSFKQTWWEAQWITASFKIKKFCISTVINSSEGELLGDVIFDQYYKQTSDQGMEAFETETILADGRQVTEVGALLVFDSEWHVTSTWRTYGHTEDIRLLDIYARYILDNRYSYKNYLQRAKIVDRDNNIDFDKVLTIQSKNYVFISYDRDFRAGIITAELIELLTTQQSYNDIYRTDLNSIDGVQASSSVVVSHVQSSDLPTHNELEGLNVGDYKHLTAAHHTDLTDGGDCSIHKHDDRYYTETEINTWRSSVTQQEMDWLHGITSDVQTQITARLLNTTDTFTGILTVDGDIKLGDSQYMYFGADNDGRIWHSGVTFYMRSLLHGAPVTIEGEDAGGVNRALFYADPDSYSALYYTGSKKIETTNTGAIITGALTLTSHLYLGDNDTIYLGSDNDGLIYHSGTYLLIQSQKHGGIIYMQGENASGVNKNLINANPDGTVNLYYAGAVKLSTTNIGVEVAGGAEHPSFTSGWQGTNWQITAAGDAEVRNLLVSGGLQVYELILNRLHYQCGGLIIGAGGGKVSEVLDNTLGSEVLLFEDPEGNDILPFTVGAIVMVQDFDLDRVTTVKKIVREVDDISSSDNSVILTETAGWVAADDDTGVFAYGDEMVAVGHVSDANLDASLYFSAVDSDNPFCRVFDGVDSWAKFSLGDKSTIKVQWGNLESIAGHDIVSATPGFGFYSDNVYLSGTIVATSGSIGGWTIDSTAIYSNDKHAGDDWADESDPGITLMDDGSIHCPNFYVNTGGEIGLREVESVLFKTNIGIALKIIGGELFEPIVEGDSWLYFNRVGFEGAVNEYRYARFYNGQGDTVLTVGGETGTDKFVEIIGETDITGTFDVTGAVGIIGAVNIDGLLDVDVNSASGFAAYFFNDGNDISRWGIGIQCGYDTLTATVNYPIRFYDGNGDHVADIKYNNSTILFDYISDIKLKENIKDYNINGLDIVSQIQYRSFNWKKDSDKEEVHGWVADEVELLYPEMISVDPETGYKMIAEGKLIPVMMAAIKELNEKVKILEVQLN